MYCIATESPLWETIFFIIFFKINILKGNIIQYWDNIELF